jgi:hypothetical protein
MKRRAGSSNRKKRAVENTLFRLGMQAKPEEVVAALARLGIEVSEGLVRQVLFDLLKGAAGMRVKSTQPHKDNKRPSLRRRTTPVPRKHR